MVDVDIPEFGKENGTMAKRKTLPKDFEQLVETGNEQEIKNVFEKCDINAYGGYNKGNAFEFLISESMMRWLLEQGADINYVDTYGYTPLMYHAGHKNAEEQAVYLVNLGADIFVTQGWNRETVLHKAVSAGCLNLVKCLLEAGADATATDANGDNPLEHAFRCAMTFDLVKLELVTAYLLEEGIPVTERLQNYMRKVAEDIEFRRKDLNPEIIDELDHAMNHLYELLHVEPVPKRVLYDGKTRIEIHAKSWQKQHAELWNLLVPGSGHAGTVQGEVVRISGKLAYELLDNGGINWDADYNDLVKALYRYVCMGTPLPSDEQEEFCQLIKSIKNADEKDINRLTELSVKWVTLNLDPIAVGEVNYRR